MHFNPPIFEISSISENNLRKSLPIKTFIPKPSKRQGTAIEDFQRIVFAAVGEEQVIVEEAGDRVHVHAMAGEFVGDPGDEADGIELRVGVEVIIRAVISRPPTPSPSAAAGSARRRRPAS